MFQLTRHHTSTEWREDFTIQMGAGVSTITQNRLQLITEKLLPSAVSSHGSRQLGPPNAWCLRDFVNCDYGFAGR
jgi:hypothetical protein